MPYSRFTLLLATLVLAALTGSAHPLAQQPAPPPQEPSARPAPGQDAPDGQAEGQDGQEPQQPVFRADITFVRVYATVTDKKGRPAQDLTADDVAVFEAGKPQATESFQFCRIDRPTATTPSRPIRSTFDEEPEAQRPAVRLFGIFLDDYH